MNALSRCHFCVKPAKIIEGMEVAVCSNCFELLKNKHTALPLIRGQLTLSLRGQMPEAELKKRVDTFMEMISNWKSPS